MSLQLIKVVPEDVPRLIDIYFSSFQDPMRLAAFPDTPSVREWWTGELRKDMRDPLAILMKVVDGDEIVAFAEWHPPGGKSNTFNEKGGDVDDDRETWPSDGDKSVPEEFFGKADAIHKRLLGDEEHWCPSFFTSQRAAYYSTYTPTEYDYTLTTRADEVRIDLDMVATAPEHQRRGAASILIGKVCEMADESGRRVYLEGSPSGQSTYRRLGFVEKGSFGVVIKGEEYTNLCMIREPHSTG